MKLCGRRTENISLPSWKLANGLLMKNMKIMNLVQYASRFCFPQRQRLEEMDLHILLQLKKLSDCFLKLKLI